MKNDIDLSSALKGLGSLFSRFGTILFFLLVSGGLFAAITILLSTISLSSTTAPVSDQAVNGTFDESTIQRLNQGNAQTIAPSKRQSPFTE